MHRCLNASIAMLALAAAPSLAQDSTQKAMPWLRSFSIGVPGQRSEPYFIAFTLGANFTQLRASALAPDFSLGVMPFPLLFGALGIGGRGGVAMPLRRSPRLILLPSAGVSSMGLASDETVGDWISGFYAGFAIALVSNDKRDGLRVGITWHKFMENEDFWLFEFGSLWKR